MPEDTPIQRMRAHAADLRAVLSSPEGSRLGSDEGHDAADALLADVEALLAREEMPRLYRTLTEPTVFDTGEFDDEFPDEHSHVPQRVDEDTVGLHFAESEGRHYYLQHKITDEGVIVDVYDRYGEELLGTFHKTWEELGEFVLSLDNA